MPTTAPLAAAAALLALLAAPAWAGDRFAKATSDWSDGGGARLEAPSVEADADGPRRWTPVRDGWREHDGPRWRERPYYRPAYDDRARWDGHPDWHRRRDGWGPWHPDWSAAGRRWGGHDDRPRRHRRDGGYDG